MFGLFKKKSELEKLEDKFAALMSEWHKLSSTNRAESDKKYAEAQDIAKQIDSIKKATA